jgi:hypothetical protein
VFNSSLETVIILVGVLVARTVPISGLVFTGHDSCHMNMQETKRRKSKSLINTTFSAVAWTLLQECLGKILTGDKSSNQHRISKESV